MTRPNLAAAAVTCLLLSANASAALAGARVDVVVGPDAPQLERFAAEELAAQFERLFDAEVRLAPSLPAAGPSAQLVVIGSPETNSAVQQVSGDDWPELTDQGLVLRSLRRDGRPVLVVGGGSPVATLWAVYELGYRFGIRYLLSGDVFPAETPTMELDRFDVVMESTLRTRTWRTLEASAIGPESWGWEQHRRVVDQLAKRKFNRVLLSFHPWQPFVHYEYGPVAKKNAMLWYGYRYPLEGDVAGRNALGGEAEFQNPEFAGKTTYEEMTQAGIALARKIIDHAHRRGMSAAIAISPLEFPGEFAAVLPEAKVSHGLERLVIGRGPRQMPDDPVLRALVTAKMRAYLETYPEVDALYLYMLESPDWVEHYEAAWSGLDSRYGIGRVVSLDELTAAVRGRDLAASGERGVRALQGNLVALDFLSTLLAEPELLRRPDGHRVEPVLVGVDPALFPVVGRVLPSGTGMLHFVDHTARRVAANRELLDRVPADAGKNRLILTLADDNLGVLPQMATRHHYALLEHLRGAGWDGYATRYGMIGELDPSVHYLSRAGFDASVTPRAAMEELIRPMCGEGVAGRLIRGFRLIEQATDLIDENDSGFAFPVPGVVMKHFTADAPPPSWWHEARTLYTQAMNEMYRGNGRSAPGGRPFIRYFAKRLEFAVEYLKSVEAVRLAGQARRNGDGDELVTQLEKAAESMYNGIDALAEVARSESDRGLIAVMNAYGYRPLLAEFEAQSDAMAASE